MHMRGCCIRICYYVQVFDKDALLKFYVLQIVVFIPFKLLVNGMW